jgi:hypothetical protein
MRVLEADPVQRIGELDVDAEVVAVELELVAGADAGVFGDVERQARQRPFDAELPVPVVRRIGAVVDTVRAGHGGIPSQGNSCIIVHVFEQGQAVNAFSCMPAS